MASKVLLLVLLSGVICNGVPSKQLPETETAPSANDIPVKPISVLQWAPEDPIVEIATKPPMAESSPPPPKPATEAPIEAITAEAELNSIVPIAGEAETFERPKPIAA